METQKTTKEMKNEETKMEINYQKVVDKISEIAKRHVQRILRVEQHYIAEELFSVVIKIEVCLPFLNQLSEEFQDKYLLVMSEKRDVLVLFKVLNPKYYEESLE